MSALRKAIAAVHAQLGAPSWAAPNLDGLADVLRDLSWLPDGPVLIDLPDLSSLEDSARQRLLRVIARAVDESIASDRPVRVRTR